ncbi:MAG: HlyD family efflux transporter periplasmic adaptor subunit [Proteobacteria bacterium]|nr:HlyD family efflux transporter periplasmic adaptor subunit [Pseudomonadota bacterium]
MAIKLSDLFRQEAIEYKRGNWLGEILLSRPVSYAIFSALSISIAASALAYLTWGEYTKKTRTSGYLVPDQGLIKIYPQQAGAVAFLKVSEGQIVKKGDLVAIISTERTSAKGSTQIEISKQLSFRQKSLAEEKEKIHQLYAEQITSAKRRLAQLAQEQQQLTRAIAAQGQRVQLSEIVVERYSQLAREKFVSELALQEKKSDLLEQQNRRRDFQRSKIASERDAVGLQADLNNFPTKERNEVAELDRAIAEVVATGFENEARRESYVLAPEDGMVTAFQADRGKQADPTQPLMSLIPAGTQIRADLYVPSRSVGFVRTGSVAQLQYQAFPYQKFGSHQGRVVNVSRTAVPAHELPFPAPPTDVYYVIAVLPDEDYVLAYGKKEFLQVGMQVDADIWLDRRTLLEWILEPLYSVSGRV